ncbi:MAG: DUF1992 domain-containing protein [Thermodesulfobacteriota bacterium]
MYGFEKIIEERIQQAIRQGSFNNLPGAGKPLEFNNNNVPEELRLAYKILKNADFIPPELELRKEIRQTEDLLGAMKDESEKYGVLKKLNFLIMKLNSMRRGPAEFDVPQQYQAKLVDSIQIHNKKDVK